MSILACGTSVECVKSVIVSVLLGLLQFWCDSYYGPLNNNYSVVHDTMFKYVYIIMQIYVFSI